MSFAIDTAAADALATRLAGSATQLGNPSGLLSQAAAEVARLAGPATPRRTGALAGSITVATDADTAGVRWGVTYARHVNYGTARMRARPFATDALAAAEPVIAALTLEWANTAIGG